MMAFAWCTARPIARSKRITPRLFILFNIPQRDLNTSTPNPNPTLARIEDMPMRYHVHVTINLPVGEHEYNTEADSLDIVIAYATVQHPNCTSVMLCIVPNKDGIGVTFDKAETGS